MIKDDVELTEIFSKRLKMLRIENGYTLKYLEEILSNKYNLALSRSNLSNYEAGRRSPYMFALVAFSEIYNVSIDYLLGKTDVKNAKILQTSVFDSEGIEHDVKIAIDKDSDIANMPVKDIIKLIKDIKNLGIDFNNVK